MFATSCISFLILACSISVIHGESLIPISTFTDNDCSVPSTTAQNVTVPIDACVVTIGMESFHMATTPCAGGGATSVQLFGFSDGHCGSEWLGFGSQGGGCYGVWTAGNAFGSILLTCKSDYTPQPDGTTTTIMVGPVATGAVSTPTSVSSSGSGSTSSSSSNNSSGTSSVGSVNGGWSSLSVGEKIGIIVALAVGIPPILIGIYQIRAKRHKERRSHAGAQGTLLHGIARQATGQQSNYNSPPPYAQHSPYMQPTVPKQARVTTTSRPYLGGYGYSQQSNHSWRS